MSEKEAGNVITSDNSAEFYANRLGLADQPEVEAVQTEPAEEAERSEPVIEGKEQEEKPKGNPKLERPSMGIFLLNSSSKKDSSCLAWRLMFIGNYSRIYVSHFNYQTFTDKALNCELIMLTKTAQWTNVC